MKLGVIPTSRPPLPQKDSVPIMQEAGWAPGPVWTGGKTRPHRDSIPDLPARSQSLYGLSYPAHFKNWGTFKPKLYSKPSLSVIQAHGTLLTYLIREMIHGSCIVCCAKWYRNNESSCIWNCENVYCLHPKCDMIQNDPASVSVFRTDLSREEKKNLKTRPLRGEWQMKFTSTRKTPSNRTIT